MTSAAAPWVRIGVLTKPHGIRGELAIHLDNPDGDVLREGLTVEVQGVRGAPRVYVVGRVFAGGTKLALDGVGDRDAALALKGAEVRVRREDFPELDDDEAYLVDLVGLDVVDPAGRALGRITAFTDNGAQPLAVIETPSGARVEMPFVDGLVRDVDEDAGRVIADPPEGLFSGDALVVEEP